MSSKNRPQTRPAATIDPDTPVPVVGQREPCPCGSGRRYKACHGGQRTVVNTRPFAGRADECDLVCLREVVPSATAPLHVLPTVANQAAERSVTLVTVLPMAWPAMTRADGSVLLALQTPPRSGDLSLDLGQALTAALVAEAAAGLFDLGAPEAKGPRIQELLDPAPIEVSVHQGFEWWLGDGATVEGTEAAAALEQANADVVPTERLTGVEAAYWCRMGPRAHLRWAMPYDEEPLLDAMARLHVEGGLGMGDGSKYVGSFRALGIAVPVWDLDPEADAASCLAPAAALQERLTAIFADPRPLTASERRARHEVNSRQLTLRS